MTPRGPVIGPALRGEVGAVSMRAMWLQPRPARGFATAHKARSYGAFRSEFAQWPLLSQNVVYADADGHVGWFLAGEVPRRRKGWGTLPAHGADPETGWHDEGVAFDAMPRLLDPESGYVASANNQPAQDGPDAPYLGVDWLDGYRAGRIEVALRHRHDWTLESTLALQMDQVSLPWREIRDIILGLPAPDEAPRFALRLLAGWGRRRLCRFGRRSRLRTLPCRHGAPYCARTRPRVGALGARARLRRHRARDYLRGGAYEPPHPQTCRAAVRLVRIVAGRDARRARGGCR